MEDGQQQLLYFSRQKKLIGDLIELYNQLKASGKNVKRKVSGTDAQASYMKFLVPDFFLNSMCGLGGTAARVAGGLPVV